MSESTFKILLTTDNHLGFAERDPRRGDDSFTTFEEVLRAARTEHDVDAMLLGGDLFHENKPSLGCLVRACSLFRKYVFGNKAVPFSLLSDPATNFPTHALPMANFQDPNINVALPVFAVHGNHDDPVGGTSSLDLLATNGYLNYFGHVTSLEDIILEPVLLRKGSTFIALYGLGNVRDERLHRCFRLKKVQFVYPKPVPGRKWFNILLLHQNRGVRGVASKNGIMEGMLAGFGMDLVIWGNEHEQLMVPQPADGFDVVQPGSTIMTSLSAQECNPKQYGILEVRGTSYRLTPYTLRSVRPVVRRTVELRQDLPDGRTLDAVETFLHNVMSDMISEAEEHVSHIPDDVLAFHPNLKYPLIRLAVDFTDVTSAPYPQPNFNRFGQQYMDVVANPGELLRPVKPKPERRPSAGALGTALGPGGVAASGLIVPAAPQLNTLDIRVKVADVFNQNAKNACTLLSEAELSAAVYAFAEKGERDAIDERLMELLHTSQKSVWRRLGNGANDSILKPDRVAEEVATHKRHVNERYARAAQLEEAQQQQQMGDTEENEDDGVAGEREGRGGAASPSLHQAERRRELDAFEMTRVAAPPADLATSDSGSGSENHFHGRFAQTSVSRLVQHAIQQGSENGVDAAAGTPGQRARRCGGALVEAGADEDGQDDKSEELPDDGLDRMPIDSVIAQAVQQVYPPSKRARSAHVRDVEAVLTGDKGSSCGVGGGGPHEVSTVHAFDGNDDDDSRVHGISRHGRARNEAGDVGKAPASAKKQQRPTSARRGGGGGSAAARQGALSAANAGSLNAASATAADAGPTLTFVAHQGVSAVLPPGNRPATVTSSGSVGVSKGAMVNLLSKWTGGSQQRH
ncbi:putative endo/exonuclease Mre11 [Leishmania infantum JPCM5]|uniref:Endo/exonuclease_Mre11_-_putative n=3 Tax=Leishmania donovani species complex TaxID=38574 RepID=A0A6L0XTC5_LEIIN|nr:putative endo/exonuclease Mre11 [Leishmania infantum JPCM5]AYU80079.1 endo/exonuclease Mre11, putative [Leishmania donovani]CAC9500291.1 endo/exonuclease_Mre11_-_putative [Leishmania infantum]CAM69147.1 putative endo/exonuclease Mre11 [Leishmania infantum JPCM5]SUZ43086.1 endo/exonuclease_Mre11_-_putative [Leishmania infantum]|eukprot:XP_001466428.1 putative endo/exonuclease Mre11 [Leishmania infantum JPCM5]